MTTPSAAPRRRPPLLMLVALAWLAAGAIAAGGTFAPLFAAHQAHRQSSAAEDTGTDFDESIELTAWEYHLHIGNSTIAEQTPEIRSPQYGIPIVLGAVVLFTGGLLALGAALTGSGAAWRW